MGLLRWIPWQSSSQDEIEGSNILNTMDLKPEESKKLQELRLRVGGALPTDLQSDDQLVKWLIARNFDVDKATSMLLKSIEWRKTWDIDSLLSWDPPEVLTKYYPVGMSGFDKEGCPVWIVPYGYCDMKGLLQSCSKRDYVRFTFLVLEKSRHQMMKQSELLGKSIGYHTVIFDLEHFSMKHYTWKPAMDVILQVIQMYVANYPELLKYAFAINAPKLFSVVYSIIKPFLDENTQQKVKIFGKSGWKEALQKEIPEDQLPEHWGGTLRDPDGHAMCPSKICLGGEVPKSFYLKKRKVAAGQDEAANASDIGHFKTLDLPHGTKETFEFEVTEPGSEIRWEFQSEDFDVGFEISRFLPSGEKEELVPHQRVNSQLVPEEGSLICTDAGTYNVVFNNEFSYLRSKKLLYSLQVVPPPRV